MNVWTLHTYGMGCGSDVIIEVYATWQEGLARWRALREADLENFDDPSIVEDEDQWRDCLDEAEQWAQYEYDSDDGWVYVELVKCKVRGLEGRNAL